MSKPIIIPESTEFVMNGTIFKYIVVDGNIQLTKLGVYNKKVKPKFIPPTLEEVKAYFKEKGYSEVSAEKAFNYYDIAGWKDSKGNQVKNWKQKMMGVWFVEVNKIVNNKENSVVNNFFQKE